jgi:uncharacterized protein YqiB (DUF1249 family)
MNTPLPPIHDTPRALQALLSEAREAQQHRRLQARYRLPTEPARTRRQVARRLGVPRDPVGRWLAV